MSTMAGPGSDLLSQLRSTHTSIRVDEEDLRASKAVMQEVTQRVLNALQSEHRIVRNFEYTGSSYEGSKIRTADEFDVMVLLDGNLDGGLECVAPVPGYAALRPNQPNSDLYRNFITEGWLNPVVVSRAFTGMVQKRLNSLGFNVPVTLSVHGPAIMLTIRAQHRVITVDLVPTFKIGDSLYVAKPYRSYADIPQQNVQGINTSFLWRKSTSLSEKALLQTIDRDQGCRRQCLKILKYIRTRDATLQRLTSFHFKMLVLNEVKTVKGGGQWDVRKMAERFLGLLQSLHQCLENGRLTHHFLPDVNLLDGISRITLQNMKGRVKSLINSEQARRQVLAV